MTTIIKVKHRIVFTNGNYTATIIDNQIISIFAKTKIADSTFKAMSNSGIKNISYDGDCTIIQKFENRNEDSLVEQVTAELESAKKSKIAFAQSLSWEIVSDKINSNRR